MLPRPVLRWLGTVWLMAISSCREDASRTGTHRRPRALRGATHPSEQRIAEAVAAGNTNKEVASKLMLSERTIESALTQIYRKLDIRSRTELALKLPTQR